MMNDRINSLYQDCIRLLEQKIDDLAELKESAILITGGTGFLGSWLCEMIYSLNDYFQFNIKLYIISREEEHYYEKLSHLHNDKFIFIRSDIKNIIELPKDVNYIIHAAAIPDSRFHTSNPMKTMIDIAEGTGAVLQAAERLPSLRMFLNVSSNTVYGSNSDHESLLNEEFEGAPRLGSLNSCYAEAKRFAENLVTAARSENRLPVCTVRPFAFIGAYQPLDSPWAANNFMMDALSCRTIRVLGDGKTIRSYMYGGDFALWVLVILTRTRSGKVYNIGSPEGLCLKDMAELVACEFNPKPEIFINASLVGNIPKTAIVPDISRAEEFFSLKIYTPLGQTLKKTIEWYRSLSQI